MTSISIRAVGFCVLTIVAALLSGCVTTVNVPVPVTMPAEIDMSPYKRIALAEIKENLGSDFSDHLKQDLLRSGRFEVVDRERLDQILKELRFSQSDIVDSRKSPKLGKLIGAAAIISGRLSGGYTQSVSQYRTTCSVYPEQGKPYSVPCTQYTRKGIYRTRGSVDVIDVQTGKILKSKQLYETCELATQATGASPPSVDNNVLRDQCVQRNVLKLVKAITPWTEQVMVPFEKDDENPEIERGITLAKAGQLNEAVKVFEQAAAAAERSLGVDASKGDKAQGDKAQGSVIGGAMDFLGNILGQKGSSGAMSAKSIANAYWNLGLARMYTWQYDRAIEAFKKAFTYNPKEEYVSQQGRVNSLRRNRERLDEQNKKFRDS